MRKMVVMCGSPKHREVIAVCAWLIEKNEKAVTMGIHLLPEWYLTASESHQIDMGIIEKDMDVLHLKKIHAADEVFVVDFRNHVGEETASHIKYAQALGKTVRWYSRDRIGQQAQAIMDNWLATRQSAKPSAQRHGG